MMNYIKKSIIVIISLSLVITSTPPLRAQGFLAVPGGIISLEMNKQPIEGNWVIDTRIKNKTAQVLMKLSHPALPEVRKSGNHYEVKRIDGIGVYEWIDKYNTKHPEQEYDKEFLKQIISWVISYYDAVTLLRKKGVRVIDMSLHNVLIEKGTNRAILNDFDDYDLPDTEIISSIVSVIMVQRVRGTTAEPLLKTKVRGVVKERFGEEINNILWGSFSTTDEFIKRLKEYYQKHFGENRESANATGNEKISPLRQRGQRKLNDIKKEWEKVKKLIEEQNIRLDLKIGNFLHAFGPHVDSVSEDFIHQLYQGVTLASFELPPQAIKKFKAEGYSSFIARENAFWRRFLIGATKSPSVDELFGVDAFREVSHAMHRVLLDCAGTDIGEYTKKERPRICLDGKRIHLKELGLDSNSYISQEELFRRLSDEQNEELQKNRIIWLKEEENPFATIPCIVYYPPHRNFKIIIERIKEKYKKGLRELLNDEEAQNRLIVQNFLISILTSQRDVTQALMMAKHIYRFLRDMPTTRFSEGSILNIVHVGGALHLSTIQYLLERTGIFGISDSSSLSFSVFNGPRPYLLKQAKNSECIPRYIMEILNHTKIIDGEVIADVDYYTELFGKFVAEEGIVYAVESLRTINAGYSLKGQFQKAEVLCEKGLQLLPHDVQTQISLAGIYYRQERHTEAIELYQKVLKKDPQSIIPLEILGIVCANAGRYEQSEIILKRAIESEPWKVDARITLYKLYQHQKRYADAETMIKSILKIDPENEDFQKLIVEDGIHIKPSSHWGQLHDRCNKILLIGPLFSGFIRYVFWPAHCVWKLQKARIQTSDLLAISDVIEEHNILYDQDLMRWRPKTYKEDLFFAELFKKVNDRFDELKVKDESDKGFIFYIRWYIRWFVASWILIKNNWDVCHGREGVAVMAGGRKASNSQGPYLKLGNKGLVDRLKHKQDFQEAIQVSN